MTIRNATHADTPFIVALGKRMIDEIPFHMGELSEERAATIIDTLIDHGFAVVSDKDGEVTGFGLGDVFVPWYTNERMGTDYAIYIAPEHRHGKLAIEIIRRFEEWCWDNGAVTIRPSVGTGSGSAVKLLDHMGYKTVGSSFYKHKES